jgi:hypothetical protein
MRTSTSSKTVDIKRFFRNVDLIRAVRFSDVKPCGGLRAGDDHAEREWRPWASASTTGRRVKES